MSRPAPNNTYKSFRQSLMIIIFLTLSFHSTFSQSLKEQSFLLTDRLLDECNVNAMCDCCASDLVFVSDNKFVLVDYCTDHGTYYTGIYRLTNDKLSLEFNQIKVEENFDYDKNELTEKKESCKCPTIEFQIRKCKNGIILDNLIKPEFRYGTREQREIETERVSKLKNSKAYKLLL